MIAPFVAVRGRVAQRPVTSVAGRYVSLMLSPRHPSKIRSVFRQPFGNRHEKYRTSCDVHTSSSREGAASLSSTTTRSPVVQCQRRESPRSLVQHLVKATHFVRIIRRGEIAKQSVASEISQVTAKIPSNRSTGVSPLKPQVTTNPFKRFLGRVGIHRSVQLYGYTEKI
jgi:hypothetical protein